MIPYFGSKKFGDISQAEQLNFRSALHRVIGRHNKDTVPRVKAAVQIFNQIMKGKIDFESFISNHYGAVDLICARTVPHHAIYMRCRYQANKIAHELCTSNHLPSEGSQLVTWFSDFKKSNNLEAITDWLIKHWASLAYGIELSAEEEQELKSELEMLFQRKLADIDGYCS
jgi:hypothetical protein